ncbi:MAG TPA: endonuclease [Phycisphaerae bacterium]|nr:endonuclease [Phycisphaerae bacterium]
MATAVYLVHYSQPRHHVRHAVRVVQAPAGVIRKLYRHLHEQPIDPLATQHGIGFLHVRTWWGKDKNFERKLKNQKHHSRLCPVCNPDGYVKRTTRTRDI